MKYYIVYPNGTVEFENRTQLINYLLKDRDQPWYKGKHRHEYDVIRDRIQITGNDTYREAVCVGKRLIKSLGLTIDILDYHNVLRDIWVLDEFGNNAYTFELVCELNRYIYREDIEQEHRKYVHRDEKSHYTRWSPPPTEFRKEPVPYSGVRHHSRWMRHPHTTQERRDACNPEVKNFIRKSRGMNLPTTWDDLFTYDIYDRSWKTCTKNRYQWENKVKRHNKHVYVVKPSLEDDVDLVQFEGEDYNDDCA